jgi:uncharacterized membrane protein YdjX (TVP38/TMEM64 family)
VIHANGSKQGTEMPSPRLKRLILPSILLAGFGMFFASGANDFFSWQVFGQHYTAIKSFTGDKQWQSYLGFFCVYMVAVAFSLPIASLLTLAGGAILGWPAATLVVVAATAGAGIVFLAAQNLFTDILLRRAGRFIGKLEDGFSKNAFFYLLALRLIPAAPFWVVNIVPALTRMGIAKFLSATFIGIIPGSCVYVWVGRGFDQVLSAGQTPDLRVLASPNLLLPLAALATLALMPVLVKFQQARVKKKQQESQ